MQVRHFKEMIRVMYSNAKSEDRISFFQAFVVALANRVGVGNIAGVAAAIGFGGPSAVFWMCGWWRLAHQPLMLSPPWRRL